MCVCVCEDFKHTNSILSVLLIDNCIIITEAVLGVPIFRESGIDMDDSPFRQ